MPIASMRLRGAHAPGFVSLVLASLPRWYYRLDEVTGSTAANQTGGLPGSYLTTFTLAQPPLRPAGGTSVAFNGSGSGVDIPASLFQSLSTSELSLITIVKPGALTGARQIVSMDQGSNSSRRWQWRLNGANVEFIKTTGTIQTVSAAHGMTAGMPYLLGLDVSSLGVVTFYRNGTEIPLGSVAPAEYSAPSSSPLSMRINRRAEGEGTTNTFSDTALFDHVLGPSVHASLAAASGL